MATLVGAATLVCCSAPAQLPELSEAERHEHAGRWRQAIASYDDAVISCRQVRKRRRKAVCASAHLGRAEALERMGATARAADAYEAIPDELFGDPAPSARALYRAGELRLQLDQDERGYTLLWRTLTEFPNAPSADLAVTVLLDDGRRRNARQLYESFAAVVSHTPTADIADNLLFAMADLAEHELQNLAAALAHYDAVAAAGDSGSLWDDALWHGARVARELGDFPGAVQRYRELLAHREVALMVGSYFSVWHDDAQLELGRVLRDELGDHSGALTAFRALPKLFPDSILQDDAMFERAATWEQLGDTGQACDRLATLRTRWPESKYELSYAPQMRTRLRCQD